MRYMITLFVLAIVCLVGCSTASTQTAPKSWNTVTAGMTREEVVSRIGLSNLRSPSNEVWRSDQWELHVAFDPDGRATNVVQMLILK